MNNLEGLHPGLVLKTMFLEPLKLSVYRLAKDIHVPQTRLSQIISGERSITPDTALRLSKYFESRSAVSGVIARSPAII